MRRFTKAMFVIGSSLLASVIGGCTSYNSMLGTIRLRSDQTDVVWIVADRSDGQTVYRCAQTPDGPVCEHAAVRD